MDQTKRILVHAANSLLPLSLIIVGVGKGNMSDMNILDADTRCLTHRGVRAKRDIVQFVGKTSSCAFFRYGADSEIRDRNLKVSS